MPIVDFVRGNRRVLTEQVVKEKTNFAALSDADQQYVLACHRGAGDMPLRDLNTRLSFRPEAQVKLSSGTTIGIRLKLTKVGLPGGVRVRDDPLNPHRRYVETEPIKFEASYTIRITPFAGVWEIDFFQTVDQCARFIEHAPKDKERGYATTQLTSAVSRPTRDAPAGSADTKPPRFDPRSVREITEDFQDGYVSLDDFPGTALDWVHNTYDITLKGEQEFTTYLIVRRRDGLAQDVGGASGWALAFAMWRWTAVYELQPGNPQPRGGSELLSQSKLPRATGLPDVPNSPVAKDLLAAMKKVDLKPAVV